MPAQPAKRRLRRQEADSDCLSIKMETLTACNLCGSSNIEVVNEKSNICRCRNCDYIFDSPRPTLAEITQYYSRIDKYDSWLAREKARDALWQRRLRLVRKRTCKKGKLLDVGTGIGQFLHFAKSYFEVSGTEVSQTAIRIAREKYGLNVSQGGLEDIDFKGQKFDVITLFHVLEHVPNVLLTIKKCRALLNTPGFLIIAVPNDVVHGAAKLPKISLENPDGEVHLSHFRDHVLERFLEKQGFEVVQATLDPYFAVEGREKLKNLLRFYCHLLIKKCTGVNHYDCLWMTAKTVGDQSI